MAKRNTPPAPAAGTEPEPKAPTKEGTVEARLLVDCPIGKINAVVRLSPADAKRALQDGWADPSPEAVAAAKALAR